MRRVIRFILRSAVIAIALIILSLFILSLGSGPLHPGVKRFGVSYVPWHAEKYGLDWRETYTAVLDDLGARHIRLAAYWDRIEPEPGRYVFDRLDWLIQEAKKRDAKIILAIGRKLPRWPECHIPDWAVNLPEKEQQEKVLALFRKIIERYRGDENVIAWQIENEPFLSFGECPQFEKEFLDREIAFVRSLDDRPIIITDSGELSLWLAAARRADIFGTTMYRTVYNDTVGYLTYPLPPQFFHIKATLVRLFAKTDKIIVIELQGEPWGPHLPYEMTLEEQAKSMTPEKFRNTIAYARKAGFTDVYLWGAEWWYWMKVKHNRPEIWEAAKELFIESGAKS